MINITDIIDCIRITGFLHLPRLDDNIYTPCEAATDDINGKDKNITVICILFVRF
jgi:hypothetical protein